LLTKSGEKRAVESRWTLIGDSQSDSRTILVVNTDVTEKRKLEAQFLRAQKLESIGRLACGIAHDINNSLSPILLVAHLLRDKMIGPDDVRLVGVLETSAQRGADMVNRVLSFARGEAGESKPVCVITLVRVVERFSVSRCRKTSFFSAKSPRKPG